MSESPLAENCQSPGRRLKRIKGLIPLYLLYFVIFSTSFPFEDACPLYVGARPLGMGNAFVAVADDASAGFWNPAGLIQWQGVRLFGTNKFHDRKDYAFDPKGIAYSYRGNAFFWGNKIAMSVSSGIPDFNYYCFAKQINSYVSIGLSLKFKRRHPCDYYQFFGKPRLYDLAFLIKPNQRLKIGLLIQDLINDNLNQIVLGSSYDRLGGAFSIDLIMPIDSILDSKINLGVNWITADWISLRSGLSNGAPTIGGSVKCRMLRIDYACIWEKEGFT